MKIEDKTNKTGYKKILRILVVAGAIAILFFASESCKYSPSFDGIYRLDIDRTNLYTRLANQEIYLEVKDDSIAYSQTVNEKMAFHHKGQYTVDEKTNTMDVKWKTGKLPNKLKIVKLDGAYVIKIGNDIYKKEH